VKKVKSKNKSSRPDTTVVGIKSRVLFRVSYFLAGRSSQKVAIHIKNLEDNAFYEFKGHSAYLWLSLDGTRTIEEVILYCKKIAQIRDPNFLASARKFVRGLLEAGLVKKKSSVEEKDIRADDMNVFLNQIKKNLPQKMLKKNKTFLTSKTQRGDRTKLMEVRRRLSKLLRTKARLKIKRAKTSSFSGQFHVFSANLSWPGQKMDNPSGFGAALTVEGAALAATGEAVERLCVMSSRPTIYSKSYNQLVKTKNKILDPESYRIFASNQDVLNLTRKTETNWTLCEDAIHQGQKIFIPSSLDADLTSNGCAADTEINKAKVKAALELIERDNRLFYWRTKNVPALIDLSKPNERIGNLLEIIGGVRKKVRLFYLKSELAPVTVQATMLGDLTQGEPRFATAGATRLDPADAIEKAIVELIYVVDGFKMSRRVRVDYGKVFDNSVWDFDDRGDLYGYYPLPDAYKFLYPNNPPKIQLSDIPSVETGDSVKNLDGLVKDFHRHGLRLYYENVTPKYIQSAGFWVYRAVSPDLISLDAHHRFRMLGYPRYYKLPAILGLKQRPKLPEQLNPWPHPIT